MLKKIPPLLVLLVFLMAFIVESCKHEPLPIPKKPQDTTKTPQDTTKTPTVACSPDTVYFVQEIQPLLNSSCGMAGCHDAQTAQKGFNVTSYQSIISSGEVKPFNPEGSDVYERISETDPKELMPPPHTGITLSQKQKDAIYKWIKQGAKNNSCESAACDTLNIKYSTQVEAILQKNCTNCHSGSNPSKGIDLASYASVKNAGSNGSLLGVLEHAAGYTPMPYGQPKINGCDIKKIRIWVNSGMPQ